MNKAALHTENDTHRGYSPRTSGRVLLGMRGAAFCGHWESEDVYSALPSVWHTERI
jgi:hypothetical protein